MYGREPTDNTVEGVSDSRLGWTDKVGVMRRSVQVGVTRSVEENCGKTDNSGDLGDDLETVTNFSEVD